MRKLIYGILAVVVIAAASQAIASIPSRVYHRLNLEIGDLLAGPPAVQIKMPNGDVQFARFYAARSRTPLIVDLHQWGQDHRGYSGTAQRLDELVMARGWNFIRPAGSRDCCTADTAKLIAAAVAYAIENGNVDPDQIHIVGSSGGGYTALCVASSGLLANATFHAWVPITDLEAWHDMHKGDAFGASVRQCTGSGDSLNITEARRMSPIHMPKPAAETRINLYAGLNDQIVPALQAATYFKRITGQNPAMTHGTFEKGPVQLTMFRGGHEFWAEDAVQLIERRFYSAR